MNLDINRTRTHASVMFTVKDNNMFSTVESYINKSAVAKCQYKEKQFFVNFRFNAKQQKTLSKAEY